MILCDGQEFLCYLDDCGSCYCELTKDTWNTWNNEDYCQDCPWIYNWEDMCFE